MKLRRGADLALLTLRQDLRGTAISDGTCAGVDAAVGAHDAVQIDREWPVAN